MVGVVGPTGGGKSTIVSLIPRFYDPTGGQGQDRRRGHAGIQAARAAQSDRLCPAGDGLFRGTVRDNIAYGRPGATDEEIIEAAKLANADEFIARMPHGYDTMVGERGERSRVASGNASGLPAPSFATIPILILDEPTAALDTESEQLVIEALERLMKGRTVITIAHRLSTIRDADQIIVLKEGVVAEQGTHDELLALEESTPLYRIQFDTAPRSRSPRVNRARADRCSCRFAMIAWKTLCPVL